MGLEVERRKFHVIALAKPQAPPSSREHSNIYSPGENDSKPVPRRFRVIPREDVRTRGTKGDEPRFPSLEESGRKKNEGPLLSKAVHEKNVLGSASARLR